MLNYIKYRPREIIKFFFRCTVTELILFLIFAFLLWFKKNVIEYEWPMSSAMRIMKLSNIKQLLTNLMFLLAENYQIMITD